VEYYSWIIPGGHTRSRMNVLSEYYVRAEPVKGSKRSSCACQLAFLLPVFVTYAFFQQGKGSKGPRLSIKRGQAHFYIKDLKDLGNYNKF
jgi:hypothetical protein